MLVISSNISIHHIQTEPVLGAEISPITQYGPGQSFGTGRSSIASMRARGTSPPPNPIFSPTDKDTPESSLTRISSPSIVSLNLGGQMRRRLSPPTSLERRQPFSNTSSPTCRASITILCSRSSRVPGSGVRGRGSGERETTASSLAGKEESSRKEDNSGQGKDGPAGAIAQGGNGR